MCELLGGTVAKYLVAPAQIKDLSRHYGGARVAKNSYGLPRNVVMDQGAVSGADCGDHSMWNGYCKCCLRSGEMSNVICCLGETCASNSEASVVQLSCRAGNAVRGGPCTEDEDVKNDGPPDGVTHFHINATAPLLERDKRSSGGDGHNANGPISAAHSETTFLGWPVVGAVPFFVIMFAAMEGRPLLYH